ncbi:hypothetical protein P8960_02000 [Enterococcus lactis]|uniref:hypothetical protein n=1 Tax=Enterococcus TaxID=1350 RepID=UPI0024153BEE|nr:MULTISPECIES: hypothetical protein [Enterococcus]MDV4764453.1 hypothetical protein [Enterococcus faecium]MDG4615701.1 hypothetical protein [Enterococcus lactis]MEB4749107.1 hypothetical protein [Enterococcus sp. E5-162]NTQ96506.1 hypothetical protein [Enterococcus faecium]HAQ5734370.1 hypothetical protein [Enterococcus faecium]
MRDVRERISLMADEIFELEMSEHEDKFWNDLSKKGLTSKHIDLPTVYEKHYCLFYSQLKDFWEAKKISFHEDDAAIIHGLMTLRDSRQIMVKRFHQIRELRYEELLREVWEEYGWCLTIDE